MKRVVGLPGDLVQVRDGVVFVNGQPMQRQPVEGTYRDRAGASQVFQETAANGALYLTLDRYRSP